MMNPLRIISSKNIFLVLFLSIATKAFPTEIGKTTQSAREAASPENQEFITATEAVALKDSQPLNASSISTTSSLLFKDKKPILTYLLGQPKKQGSVSSPAQLLSPDRYEFFTFDDDGQIVKKLMSVKEIQKIIANNEKGALGEHSSPIEYYQILTVTPDVESLPSVSRINPNEPLFSIHDVIASVQNVLKSEIKIKQSQTSNANHTNFLASASSDHIDILTEKPETTLKVEVQKVTSSTSQQTNAPTNPSTAKPETSSEYVRITTYRPTQQATFTQGNFVSSIAPETFKPVQQETFTATQKPMTLISLSATPEPVPLSASPSALKPALLPASASNVAPQIASTSAPVTESHPLSIADAHPGLISNETFLDMKPLTVEQISQISDPIKPVIEELKATLSVDPPSTFVKIETLDRDSVPVEKSSPTVKPSITESSTAKVQIAFTSDLAESVSNVLWQIASENSMIDSSSKTTESVEVGSSTATQPAEILRTEQTVSFSVNNSPAETTTEIPLQSRSTVKAEKVPENPLTVLQNILRPQNRPRPFQKIPIIEKGTPDAVELRTESFSVTTTPGYEQQYSSPSSTVVIITEPDESTPTSKVESSTSEQGNITNQEFISTTAPPAFVISVSPDAVVQSPEHVKPIVDKVLVVNTTKPQNQTSQTIEGVQVIQEANIGQIPRTTEIPGQVVKEIQRMEETDISDLSATNETLSNSASSTFSTQLPFIAPEITTVLDKTENEKETSVDNEPTVEQTTVINLEANNAKLATNDEQKEASSSQRVDITFVPMLIKTPQEFKQEVAVLKAETQTELKEEQDLTTTERATSEEITEQTEVYTTEIINSNDENLESKELPDEIELRNEEIKTTTELTEKEQKETILADDASEADFSQIGSLKQNKPYFGKPQKPVYIKPLKAKPQSESKPPKLQTAKPFLKEPVKETENKKPYENHLQSSPSVLELDVAPEENLGLEATVANLDGDIKRFADLCNELAFSLWSSVTHNGLSFVRSIVISPFAVTSLLAMVFLGARGPTSGQMNDILRLDDMVTFNPHLVFRNVTESLVISRNPGVATTAFVRELYSDKSKGKLLDFYKERVQQFYDGHVEEVNFKTIGETLRRQTNHLVKRQTWGKITDFLRGSNLMPRPPLAAFSANIFQTDCSRASTKDRDGEMYFVILPASRLRRLVPIPAVVWRDSFLAGYEPNLDATAVSISPSDSAVSTIFVLPGQQGLIAPGDTLARLEHHLLGSSYRKGHWSRLMRSLLPRPGLELQIPRLSHKSVINVTSSLQRMGLKDLFNADKADLTGLNGLANDLHLSDMLQVNLFSTCGEEPIGARHHSEVYPATPILRREKSADNVFSESIDNLFAISDFEDPAISALPLELRPRQARVPLSKPGARIPEPPRLRFDRPFLFFVRHNPTGLILHMGRFNPRLMP